MNKINLGCGNQPLPGYKNIDISSQTNADEIYDVTYGINEEDETIDEIFSGCMIEQIGENETFIDFMNDCWRVLRPGGKFKGYVPSNHPDVMFLDPMDKRFFQEKSFEYFVGNCHAWQEFGRIYGFKPWSAFSTEYKDNHIIHFELIK